MLKPQDQSFWYLEKGTSEQLRKPLKTDVVVVGGGMAGLSAAQSFYQKGLSVVLLEQYYCGAGASGKSSGFITPNAEIGLHNLVRKYGEDDAKKLWDFVTSGLQYIHQNIQEFRIACDYEIQDTCMLANSRKDFEQLVKPEHEAYIKLGYESFLYDESKTKSIIGSSDYYGAQVYGGTFGIDPYRYCQSMKRVLQENGVRIFEETPVVKIHEQGVDTSHTTVSADTVVVCVDRFLPTLQKKLGKNVFQAQTNILLSEPLTDEDVKKIFPQKNMLCWDTDLIYTYFRIVQDRRLLVGGCDIFSIAWGKEQYGNERIACKLATYVRKKFPQIKMNFEYLWPALIGETKDLQPLACFDSSMPNVYYVSGATGLAWAAALGNYAAQKIVEKREDLDVYFSPDRSFPLGNFMQAIFGKRITFSLSNLITLYK